MSNRVEDGEDALAEGSVGVVVAGCVDRPVDKERAAHDGFAVDEAPVAAVGAVVAIIAHGEIFSGRDDEFVALNVFANFVSPFDLHGWNKKLITGRRKGVVQRIVAGGGVVDGGGVVQHFAVDEDLLIDNLQVISRQANDALHEMRMILIGIFENDYIAAFEIAVRKKLFVPVAAAPEDKFVDQEMIADEKRFLHRRRRNLESLDDETGAEKGKNHGNQE